jgi:hypothetical protein
MRSLCSRKSRSMTRWALWGGMVAMASTLSASPPDSHMGQKAIDHVVLVSQFTDTPQNCNNPFANFELFRLFPSGILTKFQIPTGRALVVTDVEWIALPQPGSHEFNPGDSVTMSIRLENGSQTPNLIPNAFQSRMILITAEHIRALPGSSEQLTTGFVVASGVTICPQGQFFDTSGNGILPLQQVILRGYLIDMPSRNP